MFAKQNKGVVFLEHVEAINGNRHTFIECIPLAHELFRDCRIYFKKAIMEGDVDWSQHKKVYETAGKGLRKVLSKRLPYFYVDFKLDDGYAHIIEDTKKFDKYFGKRLLASLLKMEQYQWKGVEMSDKVKKTFRSHWKDYDWTDFITD